MCWIASANRIAEYSDRLLGVRSRTHRVSGIVDSPVYTNARRNHDDNLAYLVIRPTVDKYSSTPLRLLVSEGDGIGSEITAAAEPAGGLGLGAPLNSGDNHAMAQAQHGAALDIAGEGVANPRAHIDSTAMLLDWLSARRRETTLARAGNLIDRALDAVLADPERRTRDLGGNTGTCAFAEAVVGQVRSSIQ